MNSFHNERQPSYTDIVLLESPPPPPSTSPDRFPTIPSVPDYVAHVDLLKFFLATAPSQFPKEPDPITGEMLQHPSLNRFLLPNGDYVSCVYWNGLYHITGTDLVRALLFRFEAFGRPVRNLKKFEEGVFSDLRNLKPGIHSTMEEAKSRFLELLFKHHCIRTQKKQKVFYWFSVNHDRLFLDALERDLKREKLGQESTTEVMNEPARSFTYDPRQPLYDQFRSVQGGSDGEDDLERIVRVAEESESNQIHPYGVSSSFANTSAYSPAFSSPSAPRHPSMSETHLGKRSASDDLSGSFRRFDLDEPSVTSSPENQVLDAIRHPMQAFKRRRRRTVTERIARKASSQSVPAHGFHQQSTSPYRNPATGYMSDMAVSDIASDIGYASSTYSEVDTGVVQYSQFPRGSFSDEIRSPPQSIRGQYSSYEEPNGRPTSSHGLLPYLTCPITECRQVFNERDTMLAHLALHTATENGDTVEHTRGYQTQTFGSRLGSLPYRTPSSSSIGSQYINAPLRNDSHSFYYDNRNIHSPNDSLYSSTQASPEAYTSRGLNSSYLNSPSHFTNHNSAFVVPSDHVTPRSVQSSPTHSTRSSYDSYIANEAPSRYSPLTFDRSRFATPMSTVSGQGDPSRSRSSLDGVFTPPPPIALSSTPTPKVIFPARTLLKNGLRHLREVPLRRFRSATLLSRPGGSDRRNTVTDTVHDTSMVRTDVNNPRPAPSSVSSAVSVEESFAPSTTVQQFAPPPYPPHTQNVASYEPVDATAPSGYYSPSTVTMPQEPLESAQSGLSYSQYENAQAGVASHSSSQFVTSGHDIPVVPTLPNIGRRTPYATDHDSDGHCTETGYSSSTSIGPQIYSTAQSGLSYQNAYSTAQPHITM